MTSTPVTSSTRPRLHVDAYLPPKISFSSVEEPHIEVHIRLEYSGPIILYWKRSRLNPAWSQSAMTIKDTRGGEREHVPYTDICYRSTGPPNPPPVVIENKDSFLGLRPAEIRVLQTSFRPYDKTYPFSEKTEDKYKGLLPFGMQYLRIGKAYEVGFRSENERYMLGDLEQILGREEGVAWEFARGTAEVVVGEKCRFRVKA